MANVFDILNKKSSASAEGTENEQMSRISSRTLGSSDNVQVQGVNNDTSAFENKDGAKVLGNYAYGVESRHEAQETAAPFTIPKLKRSKQDLFMDISVESREWQQEIYPLLTKYFRFQSSQARFEFLRVSLIQNAERTQKYLEKRKEMRQNGYSERDTTDSYAFLCVDEDKQIEKISREGLHIGNLTSSTIGHPGMGAQLCRYMDTIRPTSFSHGSTSRLLVFKVMKGKVKAVTENRSGPSLEPTPNFDCHMAKSSLDVTPASQQQLYELYQMYLYEYGEDQSVEPYPRHVLPYAVLTFRYKEAPPSPRLPESPPMFSSRMVSPPVPKFAVLKEADDPEYVIWSGHLRVKDILDCQVKMVSTASQYKPAHLGTVLNVRDTCEMKVAAERYFRELTCLRKSGEVYWKGWYINVAELRPRPDSKIQFQRLMTHLSRTSSLAVLKPENDVILLLAPNGDFTNELGLARSHHFPQMFHCIFLSRQSSKFKSPGYIQKGLHQRSGNNTPTWQDSGQISPISISIHPSSRPRTAPASPALLSPTVDLSIHTGDRSPAAFSTSPRDELAVWTDALSVGRSVGSSSSSSVSQSAGEEKGDMPTRAHDLLRLHRSLSTDLATQEGPDKTIPLGFDEGFLISMPPSARVNPQRLKNAFAIQHQIQEGMALSPADPRLCDLSSSVTPVLMSSSTKEYHEDVEQDDTITSSTSLDPSSQSALRVRSASTDATISPVQSPENTSEPDEMGADLGVQSESSLLMVPKETHHRSKSLYIPPPNIPEYKPTPIHEPLAKRYKVEEGSRHSSSIPTLEKGSSLRSPSSGAGLSYRSSTLTSTVGMPSVGLTHVRSPRDLPLPIAPADSSTDKVKSPSPTSSNITTANDMKNFLNASLERRPSSRPSLSLPRSPSTFPVTSISSGALQPLTNHCAFSLQKRPECATKQNEKQTGTTTANLNRVIGYQRPFIIISIPFSCLRRHPVAQRRIKQPIQRMRRLKKIQKCTVQNKYSKATVNDHTDPSSMPRSPCVSYWCSSVTANQNKTCMDRDVGAQSIHCGQANERLKEVSKDGLGSYEQSIDTDLSSGLQESSAKSNFSHINSGTAHSHPSEGLFVSRHNKHKYFLETIQPSQESKHRLGLRELDYRNELDYQNSSAQTVVGSKFVGEAQQTSEACKQGMQPHMSQRELVLEKREASVPLNVLELITRLKAVAKVKVVRLMDTSGETSPLSDAGHITNTVDWETEIIDDNRHSLSYKYESCCGVVQVEPNTTLLHPDSGISLQNFHTNSSSYVGNDTDLRLDLKSSGLYHEAFSIQTAECCESPLVSNTPLVSSFFQETDEESKGIGFVSHETSSSLQTMLQPEKMEVCSVTGNSNEQVPPLLLKRQAGSVKESFGIVKNSQLSDCAVDNVCTDKNENSISIWKQKQDSKVFIEKKLSEKSYPFFDTAEPADLDTNVLANMTKSHVKMWQQPTGVQVFMVHRDGCKTNRNRDSADAGSADNLYVRDISTDIVSVIGPDIPNTEACDSDDPVEQIDQILLQSDNSLPVTESYLFHAGESLEENAEVSLPCIHDSRWSVQQIRQTDTDIACDDVTHEDDVAENIENSSYNTEENNMGQTGFINTSGVAGKICLDMNQNMSNQNLLEDSGMSHDLNYAQEFDSLQCHPIKPCSVVQTDLKSCGLQLSNQRYLIRGGMMKPLEEKLNSLLTSQNHKALEHSHRRSVTDSSPPAVSSCPSAELQDNAVVCIQLEGNHPQSNGPWNAISKPEPQDKKKSSSQHVPMTKNKRSECQTSREIIETSTTESSNKRRSHTTSTMEAATTSAGNVVSASALKVSKTIMESDKKQTSLTCVEKRNQILKPSLSRTTTQSSASRHSWHDVLQEMSRLCASSCGNKPPSEPSVSNMPRIPKKTKQSEKSSPIRSATGLHLNRSVDKKELIVSNNPEGKLKQNSRAPFKSAETMNTKHVKEKDTTMSAFGLHSPGRKPNEASVSSNTLRREAQFAMQKSPSPSVYGTETTMHTPKLDISSVHAATNFTGCNQKHSQTHADSKSVSALLEKMTSETGSTQNSQYVGDFYRVCDVLPQKFEASKSANSFLSQEKSAVKKIAQTRFDSADRSVVPHEMAAGYGCGVKTKTESANAQLSDPRKRALINKGHAGIKSSKLPVAFLLLEGKESSVGELLHPLVKRADCRLSPELNEKSLGKDLNSPFRFQTGNDSACSKDQTTASSQNSTKVRDISSECVYTHHRGCEETQEAFTTKIVQFFVKEGIDKNGLQENQSIQAAKEMQNTGSAGGIASAYNELLESKTTLNQPRTSQTLPSAEDSHVQPDEELVNTCTASMLYDSFKGKGENIMQQSVEILEKSIDRPEEIKSLNNCIVVSDKSEHGLLACNRTMTSAAVQYYQDNCEAEMDKKTVSPIRKTSEDFVKYIPSMVENCMDQQTVNKSLAPKTTEQLSKIPGNEINEENCFSSVSDSAHEELWKGRISCAVSNVFAAQMKDVTSEEVLGHCIEKVMQDHSDRQYTERQAENSDKLLKPQVPSSNEMCAEKCEKLTSGLHSVFLFDQQTGISCDASRDAAVLTPVSAISDYLAEKSASIAVISHSTFENVEAASPANTPTSSPNVENQFSIKKKPGLSKQEEFVPPMDRAKANSRFDHETEKFLVSEEFSVLNECGDPSQAFCDIVSKHFSTEDSESDIGKEKLKQSQDPLKKKSGSEKEASTSLTKSCQRSFKKSCLSPRVLRTFADMVMKNHNENEKIDLEQKKGSTKCTLLHCSETMDDSSLKHKHVPGLSIQYASSSQKKRSSSQPPVRRPQSRSPKRRKPELSKADKGAEMKPANEQRRSKSPSTHWRGKSRSPCGSSAASPSWKNDTELDERQLGPTKHRGKELIIEDRHHRQFHPYDSRGIRENYRRGVENWKQRRYDEEDKPEASFDLAYRELSELLTDKTSETFQRRWAEKKVPSASLFMDRCYKGQRFCGYEFRRSKVPTFLEFQALASTEKRAEMQDQAASIYSRMEEEQVDEIERARRAEKLDEILGETNTHESYGMDWNTPANSQLATTAVSHVSEESRGCPRIWNTNGEDNQLCPGQVSNSSLESVGISGEEEPMPADSMQVREDSGFSLNRVNLRQTGEHSQERQVFTSPFSASDTYEHSVHDSYEHTGEETLDAHEAFIQVKIGNRPYQNSPVHYRLFTEDLLEDVSRENLLHHQVREQRPPVRTLLPMCADTADHNENKYENVGVLCRKQWSSTSPYRSVQTVQGIEDSCSTSDCEKSASSTSVDVYSTCRSWTPVSSYSISVQDQMESKSVHRGPCTPPGPCPDNLSGQASPDTQNGSDFTEYGILEEEELCAETEGFRAGVSGDLSSSHGLLQPTLESRQISLQTLSDGFQHGAHFQTRQKCNPRTNRDKNASDCNSLLVQESHAREVDYHSFRESSINELGFTSFQSTDHTMNICNRAVDAELTGDSSDKSQPPVQENPDISTSTVRSIINTKKLNTSRQINHSQLNCSLLSQNIETHKPLTSTDTDALSTFSCSEMPLLASGLTDSQVSVLEQSCTVLGLEDLQTCLSADQQTSSVQAANEAPLNMDTLVQQLRSYLALVEQTGNDVKEFVPVQPILPPCKPPVRQPHRRCHYHGDGGHDSWKIRLWPGVPAAITFEKRNPDYRQHPSLAEQRETVQVILHGSDPRLDPNRPAFVPGGKSKLAHLRARKRHILFSIKVVKAIPLEPVHQSGRRRLRDPRHSFRSNVVDPDTVDKEEVNYFSGTDSEGKDLEEIHAFLEAAADLPVGTAVADQDEACSYTECGRSSEKGMHEDDRINVSGECSTICQAEQHDSMSEQPDRIFSQNISEVCSTLLKHEYQPELQDGKADQKLILFQQGGKPPQGTKQDDGASDHQEKLKLRESKVSQQEVMEHQEGKTEQLNCVLDQYRDKPEQQESPDQEVHSCEQQETLTEQEEKNFNPEHHFLQSDLGQEESHLEQEEDRTWEDASGEQQENLKEQEILSEQKEKKQECSFLEQEVNVIELPKNMTVQLENNMKREYSEHKVNIEQEETNLDQVKENSKKHGSLMEQKEHCTEEAAEKLENQMDVAENQLEQQEIEQQKLTIKPTVKQTGFMDTQLLEVELSGFINRKMQCSSSASSQKISENCVSLYERKRQAVCTDKMPSKKAKVCVLLEAGRLIKRKLGRFFGPSQSADMHSSYEKDALLRHREALNQELINDIMHLDNYKIDDKSFQANSVGRIPNGAELDSIVATDNLSSRVVIIGTSALPGVSCAMKTEYMDSKQSGVSLSETLEKQAPVIPINSSPGDIVIVPSDFSESDLEEGEIKDSPPSQSRACLQIESAAQSVANKEFLPSDTSEREVQDNTDDDVMFIKEEFIPFPASVSRSLSLVTLDTSSDELSSSTDTSSSSNVASPVYSSKPLHDSSKPLHDRSKPLHETVSACCRLNFCPPV